MNMDITEIEIGIWNNDTILIGSSNPEKLLDQLTPRMEKFIFVTISTVSIHGWIREIITTVNDQLKIAFKLVNNLGPQELREKLDYASLIAKESGKERIVIITEISIDCDKRHYDSIEYISKFYNDCFATIVCTGSCPLLLASSNLLRRGMGDRLKTVILRKNLDLSQINVMRASWIEFANLMIAVYRLSTIGTEREFHIYRKFSIAELDCEYRLQVREIEDPQPYDLSEMTGRLVEDGTLISLKQDGTDQEHFRLTKNFSIVHMRRLSWSVANTGRYWPSD